MKIAIVIDSSTGIKNTSDYKDLYLAPLMITKENGEQIADDEKFTQEEFYKLYDAEMLKTSQTVPGDMMKLWDELLKDYDQVLCLLLSKGLSGQYSTCKMLAKSDEYIGKVYVADTNGVSIVLKRQLLKALNLVNEGKNASDILEVIEQENQNFNVYIIPKKLDQLVRGGRISKAAAGLAKLLKITPILKYDGTIDKESKTRTFRKAIDNAIDLLKKHHPDVHEIDVAYSRCGDDTLKMVKDSIIKNNYKIGLFDEIPNTITCHTGEETFAIGVWKKVKKGD
ncbi:fatty acid-binding protein DegV [Spiroplasma corruscae]|uniref:Fatty acid-binding protein DegV n=1 Tax=Spiroplasma corruscae TaxID=216934 RepID=A0A222EN18_9MOLU|nr:DegV family protein [Spiroplasma corruscae]ASP27916.1 fatty acid-binding protein DegV [Spiroplasma corruscae]